MKVDPETVDFVLDKLVAVLSAVRDVVFKHHADIIYSNASCDSKIGRIRKLTEYVVRRLTKYTPNSDLELGDPRTISSCLTNGVLFMVMGRICWLWNREITDRESVSVPVKRISYRYVSEWPAFFRLGSKGH